MGIEFIQWFPSYGSTGSFIYCLTAILFLLSLIIFICSDYDILFPPFICSLAMTGCCGLAAIYTVNWNLPMHFITAMTIIVMVFLFVVGGAIAKSVTVNSYIQSNKTNQFILPDPLWALIMIILLGFLFLNYHDFLDLAREVTTTNKFSEMLMPVIDGITHQRIHFSRLHSYRLTIATIISYCSVIGIWVNLIQKKWKDFLKWLLILILYLPFLILTGGRQPFLYLCLFMMISFLLIHRKMDLNDTSSYKSEILIISVSLVVFLAVFLGIGVVNGKVDASKGFLRVLGHYFGMNIATFDVFMNEMTIIDTPYIGKTTLNAVYSFLNHRGFDIPEGNMYITLFTNFQIYSTNVYSAFYRYITDYGFIGCGIIMFLYGYLVTKFYIAIRNQGYPLTMILIYAYIAYPFFLLGREERLMNELVSTATIYTLVGMFLFLKFIEWNSIRMEKTHE